MTERVVVNQPPSECKTFRRDPDAAELFAPPPRVVIKVDTTGINAALEKAGRAFAEFARQVLRNPIARAAFERAQKQPSPIRGGHGPAYRARARRRTRSHR